MSDLRTRIAKIMYERTGLARLAWHRPWEALNVEVQGLWLADADAVIRELWAIALWEPLSRSGLKAPTHCKCGEPVVDWGVCETHLQEAFDE